MTVVTQLRVIAILFVSLTDSSCFAQSDTIRHSQVEIAVFLGSDCPISQKYISRLNEVYLKYKGVPGHSWTFIFPEHISKRKIKEFAAENNAKMPLSVDDRNLSRTSYFQASVTPEVIIMKEGRVLYRGAIDNWYYELGRYRQKATEHYLTDALEAIVKAQEPPVRKTTAIGCFIQYPSKHIHRH